MQYSFYFSVNSFGGASARLIRLHLATLSASCRHVEFTLIPSALNQSIKQSINIIFNVRSKTDRKPALYGARYRKVKN